MYLGRALSPTLRRAVQQFPAVLVTGPRQSGKTTFLRHEYPRASYVSFDDPVQREFARSDPLGFLDRHAGSPCILDEIQYVPGILSYLKMRIDNERSAKGRWLLTGSQQFQLMRNVSESLAGRIAILELLPLSLGELASRKLPALDSLVRTGLYPEPALAPRVASLWSRGYVSTYVERDVRQLQGVRDLPVFETFMGLMAAFHGQTFTAAEIARRAGVSLPTVKAWAGVLQASYLGYQLRPYFRNFGKRLVKTPKFYFLDPALVLYFTRQTSGEAAMAGPLGGAIFEGLLIAETLKFFAAGGDRAPIWFWRSSDGLEVDLIIEVGGRLHPVEIKLTATPSIHHLAPLRRFRELAGTHASDEGLLVCSCEDTLPLPGNCRAINWKDFPAWLGSLA
jgi:hypothetical protein